MKKQNIVKNNRDFNRIIASFPSYKSKHFIIYIERGTKSVYRFGISVGKKIGNAVTRNHIKRQVRSILSEKVFENGFNCIIIVKRNVISSTYQEIQKDLIGALEDQKLVKENKNEK